MQLSQESYRVRWLALVAAWALAAYVLFSHARTIGLYLDMVGQLGTRGAPVSTPLKQMYPAFAVDAQVWVRHALALTEGNDVRLRYTTIDNAPTGREVHWNSAWAWTIAGAGKVYSLFTGVPLTNAVERATVWLNPLVLLILIAILSAWVTRRAGLIAGMIVIAAMVGNDRIYEGFFPGYVDHHGLLTVAVFGTMLGAVLMGGGWWQPSGSDAAPMLPTSPEQARSAARFSALAGACGLWVSAASVIPGIALVGISGVLAILFHGRIAQGRGANFDPGAWRTWGRFGAAASLFFYLLEYFPNHLGIRLEANHPLHALAWLGGGELIAQFGSWWLAPAESRRLDPRQLWWPAVCVCLAPLAIVIGGSKVFSILDPFMSRLHSDYIQEFLPIWRTVQNFDTKTAFQILVVDSAPLIAGIATLTYLARSSPIVLTFATVSALLFSVLAWWQSRWMLNASGVQVCVALVVLTCWIRTWVPWSRWVLVGAALGALYVPTAFMRNYNAAREQKTKVVAQRDAHYALSRDIAAKIRASQPQGEIVMLSSPNSSTGIGYYGRFKTLGTLYWENGAGLQAAASIFAAPSEKEAAALIRAHKVTHIAIVSEENFIQQYFQLLHPKGTVEQLKQCFGVRLFYDKVVPQWLQMIPYKVPDDLAQLKVSAMLFKVNFDQNLAEAVYNVALSQIEAGNVNEADRTLDILLQQVPQAHQPWLRKGELSMARRDWAPAAEALLKGISLSPTAERGVLYTNYAKPFYDSRQYELAVRFYRAALADQKSADAACYLAWVLSTVPQDSLRNGKEALALAQEAVKIDPNSPIYLNALAAALAENNQFPEAVAAGDRALANSRLKSDPPQVQQIFAERLATIKAGRPLRVEPAQ